MIKLNNNIEDTDYEKETKDDINENDTTFSNDNFKNLNNLESPCEYTKAGLIKWETCRESGF